MLLQLTDALLEDRSCLDGSFYLFRRGLVEKVINLLSISYKYDNAK